MAYNEVLSDRIRELLINQQNVVEKKMFGGFCFMVNDKMCIGILKDDLMCRIDPQVMDTVLEKQGCRQMDFTGKQMKGFVFVDESGFTTQNELIYWVNLCLEYNPMAKSNKKSNLLKVLQ